MMRTLNRDNGYLTVRLATFIGLVFAAVGWVSVVAMWLLRMFLYD